MQAASGPQCRHPALRATFVPRATFLAVDGALEVLIAEV